jgi:cyclopropane fatty-acyl-phospholipid synthase-like methyltransferase
LSKWISFCDERLSKRYAKSRIPMNTLVESYLDEKLDVKGDLQELMREKDLFVNYRVTLDQAKFFFQKFIPSVIQHTKKVDHRLVTDHYDRGNDFFEAFLGELMVYTSAVFKSHEDDLETAQRQKLDYVAQKLQVKTNERLLDVGCGWGTLVLHMAERYGVDATGVTVSTKQAQLGTQRIAEKQLSGRARIMTIDYRDIPRSTYDKITVLEMAEHVGIKHFQKFMRQLNGLLADDGVLYLQIAGLRRNWGPEDFTWGMFMSKYIFPGADASLPLSYVTNQLEKAGFEIHSVENVGIHYSLTINRWYHNWIRSREEIVASYGERWFRLWYMFLAWSVLIAEQGRSTCFQIVANKNLPSFNRRRWIGEKAALAEFAPRLQRLPVAANGFSTPLQMDGARPAAPREP